MNFNKIYFDSFKGNICESNYIFNVIDSKITLDDGSKVNLYNWQKEMLEELINFAYYNQDKQIYYNTSLSNDRIHNSFVYNIIVLENEEIYLINLNKNKFRKIDYSFKENDNR